MGMSNNGLIAKKIIVNGQESVGSSTRSQVTSSSKLLEMLEVPKNKFGMHLFALSGRRYDLMPWSYVFSA